jgi:hypothetical protein
LSNGKDSSSFRTHLPQVSVPYDMHPRTKSVLMTAEGLTDTGYFQAAAPQASIFHDSRHRTRSRSTTVVNGWRDGTGEWNLVGIENTCKGILPRTSQGPLSLVLPVLKMLMSSCYYLAVSSDDREELKKVIQILDEVVAEGKGELRLLRNFWELSSSHIFPSQ